MPFFARRVVVALVLLAVFDPSDAIKWPFKQPTPLPKKQVKVSFDDENFSFWDPFKNTGFNATATIVPIAEEIGKRAPGYLAYATLSTGLGLFLPPKAMTAVNIAYVAAAVARSHEDVETFCKDEGRLLLGCPSVHLALVGSALRALRFRVWRGLFVRATLFRLRYQLRFMRIYRPRWVTKGASPLGSIVQDTTQAARSVQGLFPDLCHQAALISGGCQLPYWSDCHPPLRVEKGLSAKVCLDRRLKQEFGKRARRVRPGDDNPLGPGLLGWRVPHRIVLGTMRLGRRVLAKPPGPSGTARKRRSRARGKSRRGKKEKHEEEIIEVIRVTEGDAAQEDGVIVEVLEDAAAAFAIGDKDSTSDPRGGVQGSLDSTAAAVAAAAAAVVTAEEAAEVVDQSGSVPAEGPLVRFHNVTAVPSTGSTLTKSYRALAELPYGDGHGVLDNAVRPKSARAWGAAPEVEDDLDANRATEDGTSPSSPTQRQPLALQPVVIKRNLPRQILLAEDDVAAARKVLRRMSFNAEIDLDLSGVLAEVADAVARTGDLRSEAKSIWKVRKNLKRAGMLGSAVGVPEVLSCPELGPLARRGILVTTALRGVDVSNAYVMEHAAARGEKERNRFVDGVFAAFGQMCLADGCFPSNPMPENLLYMYSGQVGLTDLSSVTQLTEDQRRALCRLYRTMAELKGEDAANPSASAEQKARAAMEGVGLVIDLPPAGGIAWVEPSPSFEGWTAEEEAAAAVAAAAEKLIEVSLGDDAPGDAEEEAGGEAGEAEDEDRAGGKEASPEGQSDGGKDEGEGEDEKTEGALVLEPTQPRAPRPPLTHVMLLRGLFDTRRDDALALVGGGGRQLLRGMAVRRLPKAVAPVLRMVANLRGICVHLDVDESLLPRFSRAASKGLSWRHALATSRGGSSQQDRGAGTPPGGVSGVCEGEEEPARA